MSAEINELDVVKVVALSEGHREFSVTKGVRRAPRVGDPAMVVCILEAGRSFIVEVVNSDNHTLWVDDFQIEELLLSDNHTLWVDDFQIEELLLEVKYCKSIEPVIAMCFQRTPDRASCPCLLVVLQRSGRAHFISHCFKHYLAVFLVP